MLKIFLNIYRNSNHAESIATSLLMVCRCYEHVTVSFRHSAMFVHIVIELRYTVQNQAEVDSYFHPQNGRFIILSEAFGTDVYIHERVNHLGGIVYELDAGSVDWLIYQITWTPPEIPEAYQHLLEGKAIGYSQSWIGFFINLNKEQQAHIFKTIVLDMCRNNRPALIEKFEICEGTSPDNHIKEFAELVQPELKDFFRYYVLTVDPLQVLNLIDQGCHHLQQLDKINATLFNLTAQGN